MPRSVFSRGGDLGKKIRELTLLIRAEPFAREELAGIISTSPASAATTVLLRSARRMTPVTPIGIHGAPRCPGSRRAARSEGAVDGDVDERRRRSGLHQHLALATPTRRTSSNALRRSIPSIRMPWAPSCVAGSRLPRRSRRRSRPFEIPCTLGRRCVLEIGDDEDARGAADRFERAPPPPSPRTPVVGGTLELDANRPGRVPARADRATAGERRRHRARRRRCRRRRERSRRTRPRRPRSS